MQTGRKRADPAARPFVNPRCRAPEGGRRAQAPEVALARSTETPGPIVDETETFFM